MVIDTDNRLTKTVKEKRYVSDGREDATKRKVGGQAPGPFREPTLADLFSCAMVQYCKANTAGNPAKADPPIHPGIVPDRPLSRD